MVVDWVESNFVCDRTGYKQNRISAQPESELFHPECDYRPNWMTRGPITN